MYVLLCTLKPALKVLKCISKSEYSLRIVRSGRLALRGPFYPRRDHVQIPETSSILRFVLGEDFARPELDASASDDMTFVPNFCLLMVSVVELLVLFICYQAARQGPLSECRTLAPSSLANGACCGCWRCQRHSPRPQCSAFGAGLLPPRH